MAEGTLHARHLPLADPLRPHVFAVQVDELLNSEAALLHDVEVIRREAFLVDDVALGVLLQVESSTEILQSLHLPLSEEGDSFYEVQKRHCLYLLLTQNDGLVVCVAKGEAGRVGKRDEEVISCRVVTVINVTSKRVAGHEQGLPIRE